VQADRAAGADEEAKAARTEELQATFGTADTNEDGVLNKEEFANFMQMVQQNAGARGVPTVNQDDVSDDMKEKLWSYYNSFTPNDGGVSMEDFLTATRNIIAKQAELAGQ
jgi:Ca2+-binding EF-hand superfamily protein